MTRPRWPDTALTARLGLRYPVILAPMAGGPSTPELVAAVSNEGGLGMLGAGYLAPDAIRAAIRSIRALTDRPFGVNLFVPDPPPDPDVAAEAVARARALLEPFAAELGVGLPATVSTVDFDAQAAVLVEERVPVVSVTFGVLSARWVAAFQWIGTVVMGTASTVSEGKALEDGGVDFVVAQGSEAGAHRATFLAPVARSLIGTMALVPMMVDALTVPVIASGGIMDGRGVAAAHMLGAVGTQLGTAFLATPESGAPAPHKTAVLTATEESTGVTRVYSGRAARGVLNRLARELEPHEAELPPYPLQNALTRDIRIAAARAGKPDLMSLFAGQGTRLATDLPAAEVFRRIVRETVDLFDALEVPPSLEGSG
ncbi:MAG TPA: nitronate monooxygenase [Gemmatimonadaceae bacterium]|nr:nitronate monooxygenase [Gemmatimonadaceae bacterium]